MSISQINRDHLSEGTKLSSVHTQYLVNSVLGHGTFGITYSATIHKGKRTGKKVAIKEFFISSISSRDESGIVSTNSDTIVVDRCKEEFLEEARKLIALNHPNIVKAYDLFEANGTLYYAMDYIEGENLNDYLRHANLTVKEATRIITKVAYALCYMHESQHMLHLDLKPGNIMRRSSDGQIILIDFGLSHFFTEEGTPEIASQTGLGTKGYAPVEQTDYKKGNNFKATIDVYALGATFYKLITCETPLPAKKYLEQPELLTDELHARNIPEQTIKIVTKAMSPNPAMRYQSVMSFIYDLNSEERRKRNKGWLFSFVGLVAVIAIASFFTSRKNPKEAYYDDITDYAFEATGNEHGANHYGEEYKYKFFTDGTGFYLFKSWHDSSECHDDELNVCHLKAQTDTMSFKYRVKDNAIIFQSGNLLSDRGEEDTLYVSLPNHTIGTEKDYGMLSINEENINWESIKTIIDNNK